MTNYSKFYWLTRLDNIQGLFFGIIILCVIGFMVYMMGLTETYEDDKPSYKNKYGIYKTCSIILCIISVLAMTFIPTKDDMLLIYAGGKTMDYVQSDTSLSKIPYQTTKIISDYLDKSIKELNK